MPETLLKRTEHCEQFFLFVKSNPIMNLNLNYVKFDVNPGERE